jgi:hypothetical protein
MTIGPESAASVVAGPSGAFKIRVPAGPVYLAARRLGFAPETLTIAENRSSATFRLRLTSVAIDPVTVLAERGFSAVSSATIPAVDIRLRPQESSQELLSLVPGVVIA